MRKWMFVFLLVLTAVLSASCSQSAKEPGDTAGHDQQAASPKMQWDKPPAMTIDPGKKYSAVISTNKGDITVNLFSKEAPKTVNNFVFLARQHFYDQLVFHRVIKDFMIQTGDPLGNGTGGPGYSFEDELPPAHKYESGIVAMANAGPNTNGSQFFICSGSGCEALNSQPNYTVFGQVTSGMDVVEAISAVDVVRGPSGEESEPAEKVFMKTVKIIEQ